MPAANGFSEDELNLIEAVKRTIKILAKVIKDKNPGQVIKDIDLASKIEDPAVANRIIETDFLRRIKDYNPDSTNAKNELEVLADELTTAIKKNKPKLKIKEKEAKDIINKLARAIQEKVTPDIPGLNLREEGAIIGQLGASIFTYLVSRQKSPSTKKPR